MDNTKNSVIPVVRFSHARLIDSSALKAHLDIVKIKDPASSEKPTRVLAMDHDDDDDGGGGDGHKKPHRSKRLKLTIQDDDMTYEGIEEDESPFLIGVVPKDDSDGKERISMLDTNFFVLKPECYFETDEPRTSSAEETFKNTTYSDKLNSLTAAFGSVKKRRAMQTKLKNKIDPEALEEAVSAAVKDSMTSSSSSQREPGDLNNLSGALKPGEQKQQQFSVLPTPNTNAKLPQDCYNLLDMFGFSQEEFDRFTNESALWLADTKVDTVKEWAKTGAHSEFVCDRLLTLASSKFGHKQRMSKFKLLSFMRYLVALYKLKQNQLKSKTALASCQVPDVVVKKLYEKYTATSSGGDGLGPKSGPTMPNRMRDQLAAHILVLGLHIDDFSTDFRAFQKDLKMSIARLTDFYLGLGCHLSNQIAVVDGKKIMVKKAELRLPLVRVDRFEPKRRSTRKDG